MSTSPLPRVVVVGYHRPLAMSALDCHVLVLGLKSVVLGRPWLSVMCPPATKTRPSARSVWPEQKRFAGAGTVVNTPVVGCQIVGFPVRDIDSTRPSGSRIMWMATIGQGKGAVHCPDADASARAGAPTACGVHGMPSFARATTKR